MEHYTTKIYTGSGSSHTACIINTRIRGNIPGCIYTGIYCAMKVDAVIKA